MNKHTLLLAARLTTAVLTTAPTLLAHDPVYVTDPAGASGETIWKLEDLNGDGDFNDALETIKFYDDTLPGAIPLSNNTGIKTTPDGTVYVCDTTEDIILRLHDTNANSSANDPGEFTIFFDGRVGGNLSAVVMTSANNFCIDGSNRFFVATANTGTGGNDAILLLQDLNADDDANDLSEAREYYTIHPGAPTGDWLPEATAIGPDGAVYYTDTGNDPSFVKGIYRLEDLDNSGLIDQPNEVTPFFIPTPGPTNNQFHWSLGVDPDGFFYIQDTNFERIWRCKDLNADNDAMDLNESVLWWQGASASLIWDFTFQHDGSLIACESQTPDRLIVLKDTDCDGLVSPSEVTTLYDETLTTPIGDPRGITLAGPVGLGGTPYCFGDGSLPTPCPCANNGTCGRGCENSASTGGAQLSMSGTLVPDTLTLTSSGELPTALSIVLQGNSELTPPVSFGDGVRCVGGQLKRLYVKNAVAGVVSAPTGADPSITTQSANLGDPIAPGSTRGYQVYYRDPSALYCASPAGNTWNVSNALRVRW